MMYPVRRVRAARPIIIFAVVAALLLLSLASGVWASPGQSGLRQTVPTRTPTKMPTNTSLPPTAEPTPVPPTPVPPTPVPPTPVPPTAEPGKPTSNPTQGPATAVPTPTAPPKATVAVTTEFPKTGADFTPWIKAGVALLLIAALAWVALRLRRTIFGR